MLNLVGYATEMISQPAPVPLITMLTLLQTIMEADRKEWEDHFPLGDPPCSLPLWTGHTWSVVGHVGLPPFFHPERVSSNHPDEVLHASDFSFSGGLGGCMRFCWLVLADAPASDQIFDRFLE